MPEEYTIEELNVLINKEKVAAEDNLVAAGRLLVEAEWHNKAADKHIQLAESYLIRAGKLLIERISKEVGGEIQARRYNHPRQHD